jgi:hypothetical protein
MTSTTDKYTIRPHPEGGPGAVALFKGDAYQRGFPSEAAAKAWLRDNVK